MAQSYELLIHLKFKKQVLLVRDKNPEIENALVTSINEIIVNPTLGTMHSVGIKRLQGVIHKKHVGGRKGHRLIYLHPKSSSIVIPVYLSPIPKPPFSYDDVNWQDICDKFLDDYTKKNYKEFENFKK